MTTEVKPEKDFTAIIAAAGRSRRYGSPKLLEVVPGQGLRLIEKVISQLLEAGVAHVVTVLGPSGQPPYNEIGRLAEKAGSTVVYVDPHPPEMIDSVKAGLRHYQAHLKHLPGKADHLLVMPADLPGISSTYISKLMYESSLRKEQLVRGLTGAGRGVHPVAISSGLIEKILESPMSHGLKSLWDDSLINRYEFLWDKPDVAHDLDFPQDWKNFTENR